jgi:large subunit ribosomal protein L15
VSKTAAAAIEAAGGTVTLVPLPFQGENKAGRPAARGNQFTNR